MNLSFLDINCAILEKKYPGLKEKIFTGEDCCGCEISIQETASGFPTAVINGLHIHSPRDPGREGQRIAESVASDGGNSAVIFLGFGLGYAAEALANLAPQRPIIIVEKNINVLRKAFEARNISRFLSRDGIAFVPGDCGEGIIAALSVFEKKLNIDAKNVPVILRNRALTGLDEEWYNAIENRIKSRSMRDDVNIATKKKFGKRWIRNLTRNTSAIRDLPGISRLSGIAGNTSGGDVPVFLAAAGPGLDYAGPLLPEIRKRCIIVATDTSLRFFLRHGVDPDFALVVDPQFWNSRHLDRCANSRVCLIAESAVYPPVLRLPFKAVYLCGSLFPLGTFIEQRVDPKGLLGAGGSVATTAWDFSRLLGANEIWISGLDLSFPGLKTHFKGALFEEKALCESGRLNPGETWLHNALQGGIPFNAPSIAGGQVLTDRRLSLYAAWFENNFRKYPVMRNISLSAKDGPGGLAINGLEPAEEEALLALPPRRRQIDERLEAVFSRIDTEFFAPDETRRRGERYENAVTELRCGLERIKAACKKGEALAAEALRHDSGPSSREKTLAALDEINRFITGSEVKEIAGFLFPAEDSDAADGTHGHDTNEDPFRSYLKSSLRLYRSLEEAAEWEQ